MKTAGWCRSSPASQDGREVAEAYDRGEDGFDGECRGPRQVDRFRVEQPLDLTGHAAWLSGSEGAGVADTLFGKVPSCGKLPVTWPRTLAQEPSNIGDAIDDPLFRYGFGLTHR